MNRIRTGPRQGARPRALLLATQYRSGPWCVRSLRDAGFDVVGAEREGSVPAQGRSVSCPRPQRFPAPASREDDFLTWVQDACERERIDVVLPNSEDAVRILARRAPSLGRAVVAGPDALQYARLCDKAGLAAAAAECGADHPASMVVAPGAEGPLPATPLIVKAALSSETIEAAAGTVFARTAEERDEAVGAITSAGSAAVVQEMVVGVPWVLHGVRSTRTLGVVAAEVATTYPRRVGVSSVSRSVPCPEGLLAGTAALLDLVGYIGPFCINAIERDGRYMIHDVNLRVAASVALAIRAGLEVPGLGARAALGIPLELPRRLRAVTYVRLDGEVKALRDAFAHRGLGGSPARVSREFLAALRGPRPILDPNPLDPVWSVLTAGRAARRATRRMTG